MEIEKVKEIKKHFEERAKTGSCLLCKENDELKVIYFADILTLINDLESENERLNNELKKYKMDWLNGEKMHLQAEMEETEFELLCANKLLKELTKENQQLKDRIAELGNENAELKVDLKNSIDMQKQMLDGFKTVIKEVEENIAREIPNLLKQFAEMLKEKAVYFGKHDCEHNAVKVRTINETLKKFINTNKGENNE